MLTSFTITHINVDVADVDREVEGFPISGAIQQSEESGLAVCVHEVICSIVRYRYL